MKEAMGDALVNDLVTYSFGKMKIERTEAELLELAPTILSSITGVKRSAAETQALLGGSYVMTNDNLLKMVAIFARVRCKIPVVLMGECGCGTVLFPLYQPTLPSNQWASAADAAR
jgi:hypothetical protein